MDRKFNPINPIATQPKSSLELRAEKIKELKDFCSTHGNPIAVIDGEDGYEAKESIEGDESAEQALVEALELFLSGPMFTDIYGKDNINRRIWERKNFFTSSGYLSIYNIYSKNRLAKNNCASTISFFDMYIELMNDSEVKLKLIGILEKIHKEIGTTFEPEEKVSLEQKKQYKPYDLMEDEEKVKIVKRNSSLLKEALNIMKSN
jgi:hypothetical protein